MHEHVIDFLAHRALAKEVAEKTADLLETLLKATDDGQPDEEVSEEEQTKAIEMFLDDIALFNGEDLREDWQEILAAYAKARGM